MNIRFHPSALTIFIGIDHDSGCMLVPEERFINCSPAAFIPDICIFGVLPRVSGESWAAAKNTDNAKTDKNLDTILPSVDSTASELRLGCV